MRFQTESITDLFAEALGLTALPLLDVRARGLSAREQLRGGMERLGFREEPVWNPQAHHHECVIEDPDGYQIALCSPQDFA